jgi:hypothetical protein
VLDEIINKIGDGIAFKKIGTRSSIIAVSPLNHDAEAIMLNTINYRKSGNAVITI